MNKVIVLGGHLSVIRSLGKRKEIDVITLSHNKFNDGLSSKYNSETALTPDPRTNEQEYVNFLLKNGERWKGALLIESSDLQAIIISKNKQELSQYYKTATADWDILEKYVDKRQLYKMAMETNVPFPYTIQLNSIYYAKRIKDELPYPCLLKPINRDVFLHKFGRKNFVIRSPNELISRLHRCFDEEIEVLVQEIIPGPDSNLEKMSTYINSKGSYSVLFFLNKFRQNPPQFGVGQVGFSTSRNPELEDYFRKLLNYGDYRGYAGIEFKRDSRDGKLKLMEINVRIERGLQLAVDSGIDYPWIIYNDIIKDQQLFVNSYIEGVYWIDMLPDIYNYILNPYKVKRSSLKDQLFPYTARQKSYAVFNWNDIRPFLKRLSKGIVFLQKMFEKKKGSNKKGS